MSSVNSGFTFFKSYPEPAFVIDPDGTILDANAKFEERFTKQHVNECRGRNIFEDLSTHLNIPEIATKRKTKADEVLRTGRHISFEDEQNGRLFRSTIYPVRSQKGKITQLIVVIQDVTEERIADRAVKKDLAVFNALLEAIPGAVVIVDANRQVKGCNRHAQNILGKSQENMDEVDLFETIHPDDRSGLRRVLSNILNSGIDDFTEARMRMHDRQEFMWYALHGRKLMIDDQPHVLGIGINIDQLKKAEAALVENKIRFSLALEGARAGVWEADLTTGENVWSETAWKLYGLEGCKAQASTQLWASTIHPDDREMAIQTAKSAGRNNAEINIEYRVTNPDGSIRWLMARGLPVFDTQGNVKRYIGTVIDITDRKIDEEEREELQRQLQQSQKMELIGQLAGGIAHDFNNSLTAIIGNVDILLSKVEPSLPIAENIRDIRKTAIHSANLTKQLLGFARRQMAIPKPHPLNLAVENLMPMLNRLFGERIRFAWQPDKRNPVINIDPSQLDQILSNLCVNARDAITGNGTITVSTYTDYTLLPDSTFTPHSDNPGEYVRLTVSDTGCGIDSNTLPHIFEPFFTTKGAEKGIGLGLSTVYGIVRQNKGHIDCQTEPGKGTTFNIYLPRHRQPEEHIEPTNPEQHFETSTETVLLVEDEPNILKILKNTLEDKGFRVLTAFDAETATLIAENYRGKIDLLITDIILPKMTGIELSYKLQANDSVLRSLFMSGFSSELLGQHGMLTQANNFIQKPFLIDDFMRAIYRVLQR
ncbi:MAG TPA: PAS domain S-box protein [Chlorobaculum sp.]|nr:PAS domain S-box protein [Chlorobaculum sp.]